MKSETFAILDAGCREDGLTHSWQIDIPAALTYNLLPSSTRNWHYTTTEQEGLGGRPIDQPRGKVLGGSSCLNAMVYIRGHPLDFERWDEEIKQGEDDGVLDWSYKGVLPYFKKAQTSKTTIRNPEVDSYKGFSGPLEVTNGRDLSIKGSVSQPSPLFDVFVEAGKQAGYRATDDFNGYSQEGFGPMDQTVRSDGVRCSTAKAYLRPAADNNDNLEVMHESMARRIIWDDDDKTKAVGVEYEDEKTGEIRRIMAEKEVICCLGAIGTPQLLQVSGVGDGERLKSVGVSSVVIDNPNIGMNLQDHLEFYMQYKCKQDCTLYPYANWMPYPHKKIGVGLEWFASGTGIAASNQFETGGFVRSRPGLRHPDIQYHFVPSAVVGQLDILPHHAFQAHVGTLRPTSRGEVFITSPDVKDHPKIDPRYLTTKDDVEDLRNAYRLTDEIVRQPAFDDYRGEPLNLDQVDIDSDESVDKFIRERSHSAYHPSCTVAMGTCVSTSGLVLGASNLRVVDASIMPSMSSGNLNAPTIMIAEKIADEILGRKLEPDEANGWFEPKEQDRDKKQRCGEPMRSYL